MANELTSGDSSIERKTLGNGGRSLTERSLLSLASLRLTVVLLFLLTILVFIGTLAQDKMEIKEAERIYFSSVLVIVPFDVFFPSAFFPDHQPIRGAFPFPGGFTLGLLLAMNLVAAHAIRFKVQVRGARLVAGLSVTALGCALTYWMIASGMTRDGALSAGKIDWDYVWRLLLALMSVAWVAMLVRLVQRAVEGRFARSAGDWVLIVASALLGWLLIWLLMRGEAVRLNDSSMRILWQLMLATFAGGVLLGGCWLLFRQRGGIVLLHAGVALLMFNELLVRETVVEQQMSIVEGQTVNFTLDPLQVELAVVSPSGSDADVEDVVAVPQWVLQGRSAPGFFDRHFHGVRSIAAWLFSPRDQQPTLIQDQRLPFDVRVQRFYANSKTNRVTPDTKDNLATAGAGLQWFAEQEQTATGTEDTTNLPAIYVELLEKGSDRSLGTFLTGLFFSNRGVCEEVSVDGKTYQFYLRNARQYKPYTIKLVNVRKDDYIGTNTPRNYSSDIELKDPQNHVDRDVRIWMNNPLRYAGETFYQSNYYSDPETGKEGTGLAVVANTNWMIPYVGCMIVVVGMFAQFALVLLRFLRRRREADETVVAELAGGDDARSAKWLGVALPVLAVALAALVLIRPMAPHRVPEEEMDLQAFGRLPVVYGGRVKPMDTMARSSLRILSNKQTFKDNEGERQPAIRWLLDVIADTELASEHKVVRIDNPDVLQALGLAPRKGFLYSKEEVLGDDETPEKDAEFRKQVKLAREQVAERRSAAQRKMLELESRVDRYLVLAHAFRAPSLPDLPAPSEWGADREAATLKLSEFVDTWRMLMRLKVASKGAPYPRAVPLAEAPRTHGGDPHETATWTIYNLAKSEADMRQKMRDSGLYDEQPPSDDVDPVAWNGLRGQLRQMGILDDSPPDARLATLHAILTAYAQNDAETFNREVAEYAALLADDPPTMYAPARVDYEVFFNRSAVMLWSLMLYLLAFIISVVSWLNWNRLLSRTAFWMIVFTLLFHSYALIGRMYIMERPPVTNLYTSAVFIGWGCVGVGIILELVFRMGIGNAIGALTGFLSLCIAHLLTTEVASYRGDTFQVMQAVLDTNFWLATHVVFILFGYVATFVAGFLGLVYIVLGLFNRLDTSLRQSLPRMIYGTLCFGVFFSFFGTVLGGLWADDSWGRFWGWDPKENGALMIVLWNAIVLHAWWGRMVRGRGLAVLSIFGNVVTAWAWFGVNELRIGLHTYGFTEGVLFVLVMFAFSQIAVMIIGMLPLTAWQAEPDTKK